MQTEAQKLKLMKKVLLLLIAIISINAASAQRDYDDLLELIVDEKYERCLVKADKYIYDEDTKKDPLPYLYSAMAMFRINASEDESVKEKYPKASKEALKFASKYAKKDKESEFYAEFTDFFVELRAATYEEAENYDAEEKYTKSKGLYKYLTVIDPNDPAAVIYQGFTEWALRSKREAEESFEAAKKILNEKGIDHLEDDQVTRLRIGIMMIAEYFEANGERALAVEWMKIGQKFFADNDAFSITYQEIVR